MKEKIASFFDKPQGHFVTLEILLILGFLIPFQLMQSYVMDHGGVDIYMLIALPCLVGYAIVMSLYVGYFMGSSAGSKGKPSLLWFVLGILMTLGSIFVFGIFGPLLSTLLSLLMIRLRKKTGPGSDPALG